MEDILLPVVSSAPDVAVLLQETNELLLTVTMLFPVFMGILLGCTVAIILAVMFR